MRFLTGDREVVDAAGPSSKQIAAFLVRTPPHFGMNTISDGTEVLREKCFHPDKALLLEPLSQEMKEKFKLELEKDPYLLRRFREQAEARGMKLASFLVNNW
jgi:hypothetical protein